MIMLSHYTTPVFQAPIPIPYFPTPSPCFIVCEGFNTPPLGALCAGGAGDMFPRKDKDFKVKSLIPSSLLLGFFIV